MKKKRAVVTVRCVICNARRDIGPGEVEHGMVPMCKVCSGPMVPVRARSDA